VPQRVVVIGNPVSGRGRGAVVLAAVERELRAHGCLPLMRPTQRPGHAPELASEAIAVGADLVLVVGGDGTFRDTAGPLAAADVPVALLPAGTGNDLARTLGIGRQVATAVRSALHGPERLLDVWQWNEYPFLNAAGVGVDATVAEAVNRRFRRLRGTPAYLAGFASVLPSIRPFEVSLEWPGGGWQGRVWLTVFANARSFGGGMQIAPKAVVDDGLLDVTIIEDLSKLGLMVQFPKVFWGAHIYHPRVQAFRVERVRVEASPRPSTLDGELLGSLPAEIRHSGHRLRVRMPLPRSGAIESDPPVLINLS
jgi:diacylglycerol kinase (ATP)